MKNIREYLITVARTGKTTVSYSQLVDQLDLFYDLSVPNDRNELGKDLEEISLHEFERGRPLLSSLVIHKGGKSQGDGYYKMCEKLFDIDWKTIKSKKDNYERKEMEDCRNFWKDNDNFRKFKED